VDTRPDTGLFIDGICSACLFTEARKKETVDWKQRNKELAGIVQWGKENTKSSYDCIVTVSGGKDSMRQAFFARDELKLKPLLVSCVYPPEQLHERGADNLSNLVSRGFDTVCMSLNPQIWKKMMRQAFFKFGNQAKSTELALYAIPIHVAIAYKIPLIFLGENPLYTMGQQEGKSSGGSANGMQYSNTLQGGSPDPLSDKDIALRDVYFYRYPCDDEIEYAKLRVVYLGYYIEDWSNDSNAQFALKRGLKIRTEPPAEIGDIGGFCALDEEFKIVNQMIKYVKFGFGSVTDQLCMAINQGLITREKALELVDKYDGKCHPRYIDMFCKYLEISTNEFWEVVEKFRGKHVWQKDEEGQWKLKIDSFPKVVG
jgi:N-acetyl sugar amidotransferase